MQKDIQLLKLKFQKMISRNLSNRNKAKWRPMAAGLEKAHKGKSLAAKMRLNGNIGSYKQGIRKRQFETKADCEHEGFRAFPAIHTYKTDRGKKQLRNRGRERESPR